MTLDTGLHSWISIDFPVLMLFSTTGYTETHSTVFFKHWPWVNGGAGGMDVCTDNQSCVAFSCSEHTDNSEKRF